MFMKLRIIFSFIALWLAMAAAAAYGVKDIPNVQLADSTRFVSDPAGVLSPEATGRIDRMIRELRRTTTAEFAVVLVDEADTDDLDRFATDLFTAWGLGRKDNDNGVLLLISRDQRRAVIRTGRGMEGVLTDAMCNRVIRNVMAPEFREGRYDEGTVAAVAAIRNRLEDPDNVGELRGSAAPKAEESFSAVMTSFFLGWIGLGLVLTVVAWIWYAVRRRRISSDDLYVQYHELSTMKTGLLVMGAIGLGLPLVVWLALKRRMKRVRHTPRKCPRCDAEMVLLDEETDNKYLTAPQDTEERINSVDYDVWLCPRCGDTVVLPYVNASSGYMPCRLCHSRSAKLMRTYMLRQPTTLREGVVARVYHCRHCGQDFEDHKPIPKVVAPVIIPGGRGGNGGGGFGGGSFGGGMTLGGGSSGGW